jgi:hypothetical protein
MLAVGLDDVRCDVGLQVGKAIAYTAPKFNERGADALVPPSDESRDGSIEVG